MTLLRVTAARVLLVIAEALLGSGPEAEGEPEFMRTNREAAEEEHALGLRLVR